MPITPEQCRAARGLLGWSQQQLAENASVSRATVADFEANYRDPMRNNLASIEDCMFAAGVEFLAPQGEAGEGVRFRRMMVKFNLKSLRIDRFNRLATMKMTYAAQPFTCMIDLDAIDDLNHANFKTDAEFEAHIVEVLPRILAAVEKRAKVDFDGRDILVTFDMLDPRRR